MFQMLRVFAEFERAMIHGRPEPGQGRRNKAWAATPGQIHFALTKVIPTNTNSPKGTEIFVSTPD
jgi:hypothetical protein